MGSATQWPGNGGQWWLFADSVPRAVDRDFRPDRRQPQVGITAVINGVINGGSTSFAPAS
jgi:hypothetical protein